MISKRAALRFVFFQRAFLEFSTFLPPQKGGSVRLDTPPLFFRICHTHHAKVFACGWEAMAALPGNLASVRAAILESLEQFPLAPLYAPSLHQRLVHPFYCAIYSTVIQRSFGIL